MSRPLNPDVIIKTVADWYRIRPSMITQRSRRPRIVRARHVVLYLLRDDGRSLSEAGDVLKRDHASVIYACNSITRLKKASVEFNDDLQQIVKRVRDADKQAA